MNQQQFDAIQERWAKASSGPWTVLDETAPPYDKPGINTYEDAVAAGLVKDIESWARFLEKQLLEVADQDTFEGDASLRMRSIYAMSPKMVVGRRQITDKQMARKGQYDGEVEPIPSFLVSAHANPDDVAFVRSAAEDMGALLHAYEAQREKIEHLETRLEGANTERQTALSKASELTLQLARLRSALATIRALVPMEGTEA